MIHDRTYKISSAYAKSASEFAIGLSIFPIDMEDSYTRYLIYDGSLEQPWAVVEANRNTSDINGNAEQYFALSEEEYVHVMTNQSGATEEIKGMGIHANDATEGAGIKIANISGVPFIAGQGRQLYRREGKNNWVKISTETLTFIEGQTRIDFLDLDGKSTDDIILCGKTSPLIGRTD